MAKISIKPNVKPKTSIKSSINSKVKNVANKAFKEDSADQFVKARIKTEAISNIAEAGMNSIKQSNDTSEAIRNASSSEAIKNANKQNVYGKTVTSLPKDLQEDLKDISDVLKKYNSALKRMQNNPKMDRRQVTSFMNQFKSANPELFNSLTDDGLSNTAKTGLKTIRNEIRKYYEDNNIPYDEKIMLKEKLQEIKADYQRIEDAGMLKPKEFVEKHWKQVNLVDKALMPKLLDENAEIPNLDPTLKEKIANRFFELKEDNKYQLIKSDEILQDAYDEIMNNYSDDMIQEMEDEANAIEEFGNILGFDDFNGDGFL